MVDFQLAHESDANYTDPEAFNPDRFIGGTPPSFRWVPFGGGINRCVGASFANMEMDITLRTLFREFRFTPTDAPDESRNFRGVAIAPGKGATRGGLPAHRLRIARSRLGVGRRPQQLTRTLAWHTSRHAYD